MSTVSVHQVRKGQNMDTSKQLDATHGNRCLRARKSKIDYCELKCKPQQLYRLVPVSRLSKGKSPEPLKKAQDDVDVQLPDQTKAEPVWNKHSAKALPLLPESEEPVRVHVTYSKTNITVYGLWTNAQAATEAVQLGPVVFVQCTGDTYQPVKPEVKVRNHRFVMLTGLPTSGRWRTAVKLDQQLSIPDGPTFDIGTSLAKVFKMLSDIKSGKQTIMATECVGRSKNGIRHRSEKAASNKDQHEERGNGNVVVKTEQQDTTTYEVIVIDNGPWEPENNSDIGRHCRGKKQSATSLVPELDTCLTKRAKTDSSPRYPRRARATLSLR